jgi:hypothetical protein
LKKEGYLASSFIDFLTFYRGSDSMTEQQKPVLIRCWRKGLLPSKRALFWLLIWFLYAAILITTHLQLTSDAETKKQPPSSPDWLMMSVGASPLSIYLKFKIPHPMQ